MPRQTAAPTPEPLRVTGVGGIGGFFGPVPV